MRGFHDRNLAHAPRHLRCHDLGSLAGPLPWRGYVRVVAVCPGWTPSCWAMQLESSPSSLQLFLRRTAEEIFEPDAAPDAPLVRFAAYGAHQRVFGWVRLKADRLTDLLNAHDELRLEDVDLETFANGLIGSVDEVVIRRRDLIAVRP